MKTWESQLDLILSARDGLSYREIGRKQGCDPRTAKKYIEHPELFGQPRKCAPRVSLLDDYRSQVQGYLSKEDGNYQATWIFDALVKSGYTGGYEIVKRLVRQIKGEKQKLAYLRFETMPGEQAQVDFGEFQVTEADGTVKKYFLFAMVLGYSRKLFLRVLERCDLTSFLECHVLAFEYFGGVPREVLYDRMRNVFVRNLCVEKDADQRDFGIGVPKFTQGLMGLATHYCFRPRVAPAYAPWVKGKIERPMDFIREGFWRGYEFMDLEQANVDLETWNLRKDERIHGTTHERITDRFHREIALLMRLPAQRCDVSLRLTRKVGKDCLISVEANRFQMPHTLVGKEVTIRMKDSRLRIFAGAEHIVDYDVPNGKGQMIQNSRYSEALRADRELQARKFSNSKGKTSGKGRAVAKPTISPSKPKYPVEVSPGGPLEQYRPDVDVQQRSVTEYARFGGEVGYDAVSAEYGRFGNA